MADPIQQSAISFRPISKSGVTTFCRIHNISFFWQPRFYEHVIRNDRELSQIREYIENNPLEWELDDENPEKKDITTLGNIWQH